MKKFLAILATAVINTPVLFGGGHVNIPIDHLVDGMPVVFMVTGQKITPQQHSEFKAAIDEWYASDCFLSQQHSVDIVVDADGAVTHVVRWATKEAFLRDQGIQCKEFDDMFGKIAQIGGADLKMSATTSIAPSPR
jgi:hypothetical protein